MKLIFSRTDDISSHAIRFATRIEMLTHSKSFSHVAAMLDDNQMLDSMWGHGVRQRSVSSYLSAFPDSEIVEIQLDPTQEFLFKDFLTKQLNKRYDNSALWAFVLPEISYSGRVWQNPDKWFCSELVCAGLIYCGYFTNKNWETYSYCSPNRLFQYVNLIQSGRYTSKDLSYA